MAWSSASLPKLNISTCQYAAAAKKKGFLKKLGRQYRSESDPAKDFSGTCCILPIEGETSWTPPDHKATFASVLPEMPNTGNQSHTSGHAKSTPTSSTASSLSEDRCIGGRRGGGGHFFDALSLPGDPSHTVNQEARVKPAALFSSHKHGTLAESSRPLFHCCARTKPRSPVKHLVCPKLTGLGKHG